VRFLEKQKSKRRRKRNDSETQTMMGKSPCSFNSHSLSDNRDDLHLVLDISSALINKRNQKSTTH